MRENSSGYFYKNAKTFCPFLLQVKLSALHYKVNDVGVLKGGGGAVQPVQTLVLATGRTKFLKERCIWITVRFHAVRNGRRYRMVNVPRTHGRPAG